MLVQFNESTSVEVHSKSFIHSVSTDDNVYSDYDELTEEQQLAYEGFKADVERVYRRLLTRLDQLEETEAA